MGIICRKKGTLRKNQNEMKNLRTLAEKKSD